MFGISLALTGFIIFIFSISLVGVAPTELGGSDKDWLTYTFQYALMAGVIFGAMALIVGLIMSVWAI